MRDIFIDPAHQHDFDTKGYIQIQLLSAKDIAELLSIFEQHRLQYSQVFHTSHFSTDIAYKEKVHTEIVKVIYPMLEKILVSCRPMFGNFMIKNPDKEAFMPLHSDWTYVDEHFYRSLAAWIPLVDTNPENGCLGVIEGSHKIANAIRGPRIRQSSYDNDRVWVEKYGKLLPSKAGMAVIYDHGLMHYSPPNTSSSPRPAINLSIVPQEAEVIHYCIPEGAQNIEKYIVDQPSFYINYNNFQRPQFKTPVESIPSDKVPWIDDRMNDYQVNKVKPKSLWSRLFSV